MSRQVVLNSCNMCHRQSAQGGDLLVEHKTASCLPAVDEAAGEEVGGAGECDREEETAISEKGGGGAREEGKLAETLNVIEGVCADIPLVHVDCRRVVVVVVVVDPIAHYHNLLSCRKSSGYKTFIYFSSPSASMLQEHESFL
eukprot:768650-Hanusia_phi.AAC.11